jgi:para-aminobenzoate synthetase component 1
MPPIIQEIASTHTPERLGEQLRGERGVVLLRSRLFDSPHARYSFLAARPFLTFRSFGSRCEVKSDSDRSYTQFGDPWRLLDCLMARYELLDQLDHPFPLGGCFGYWGYDLRNFTEPKLPRRAPNDLDLPDCHVGFYESLIVFDHHLGKTWIVATGLAPDGARTQARAHQQLEFWQGRLSRADAPDAERQGRNRGWRMEDGIWKSPVSSPSQARANGIFSNLARRDFISLVERAKAYIRSGDIYQVNLSHRLSSRFSGSGWDMFQHLSQASPAPFSAYLDCDGFQLASSSPELFLAMSGGHVRTRPIKGTRPRSADLTRDAQLAYELQTSSKEMAELIMITDLLRNDLGRICQFGSVEVPELVRLERYSQVQHLVSTVEGRLRPEVSHFAALGSCFPGGSVTGAPKFRAMAIIDELEPVGRGPYTGALGYLGFNRESQLSIIIRTALCLGGTAYFQVGAGIVADSQPADEYEETLAKAQGFCQALQPTGYKSTRSAPTSAKVP